MQSLQQEAACLVCLYQKKAVAVYCVPVWRHAVLQLSPRHSRVGETTEALSCQPDRKIVVQVMLLLRENPGDCKLVSLILLLGKVVEKIILGATEKFKKKKKKQPVSRHTQHGFTRKKSCLSNLIYFSDKVTCLVDEGKAMHIIFLYFSKAFNTIPYGQLILL